MSDCIHRVLHNLVMSAIFTGTLFIVLVVYEGRPNHVVRSILRLEQLPASVTNADCESWSWTDVLTTCTFKLDPRDFPQLLKGWPFRRLTATGGSYSFSGGPRLGREFAVNVAFAVDDSPEFPNGGRIALVADAQRARVQLDYYVE